MKVLKHFFRRAGLSIRLLKWVACPLTALLTLAVNFSVARPDLYSSYSSAADSFTVKRGTNISHWLSQSDRRGDARREFFTQDDVRYLAGLGFDHLRIPVDEEQLFDEAANR